MVNILQRLGFKIILYVLVFILAVYLLYTFLEERSKFSLEDALNLNGEEKAAEFTLTHVDGNDLSLADTDGKVRLVYFYFSHCTSVCAPTTHILSRVQEQLKDEGGSVQRRRYTRSHLILREIRKNGSLNFLACLMPIRKAGTSFAEMKRIRAIWLRIMA